MLGYSVLEKHVISKMRGDTCSSKVEASLENKAETIGLYQLTLQTGKICIDPLLVTVLRLFVKNGGCLYTSDNVHYHKYAYKEIAGQMPSNSE